MAQTDHHQKYFDSVEERGYNKLKPLNREETIAELVAEGMKLLKAEENPAETPPCDNKRLQDALAATTKNPYVRARLKILNDMSEERKRRIEEMESNGKTDNPTYAEFAKKVIKLGDKFSEKSS